MLEDIASDHSGTPSCETVFDAFGVRFQALYAEKKRAAVLDVPALRGSHEGWKAFIHDAVDDGVPARPELIVANEQLAAWEAVLGIGRVSSFPVTVSVSFTEICNARCSFCAYSPQQASAERVQLDDIQRADWLRFCKTFTPNGGSLGEPFAHPNTVEILRAVRTIAPFIRISIISNGSLIRRRAADAVVGFVDTLKISLNAARRDTYEKTMSPLKWDETLANLTYLRDAKLSARTRLPALRAGYVLHTENVEEFREFPGLIHSLGFTELYVNVMHPPRPTPGRELMTRRESIFSRPRGVRDSLEAAERDCETLGLRLVKRLPAFG